MTAEQAAQFPPASATCSVATPTPRCAASHPTRLSGVLVVGAMLLAALVAGAFGGATARLWPSVAVIGPLVAVVAAGLAAGLPFEHEVAEWADAQATALSTDVLTAVTQLGGTLVVTTLALITVVAASRRMPKRVLVAYLVLVILGQSLIVDLVKAAVDRARPDIGPLAEVSRSAFPSGHSATAAAAYAAMALLIGRGRAMTTTAWLAGAAAGVAGAVAATRVLLGVHWVTDVLAGLALGWGWFALCSFVFSGRLRDVGSPLEDARAAAP